MTQIKLNVAIIGAGMSGATAACLLHEQGHSVTIFEKSRGFGGRMATRMGSECTFDHGAQYFTCQDPHFLKLVETWQRKHIAAPWEGPIASWDGMNFQPVDNEKKRFVGVPNMTQPVRNLCANAEVKLNHKVTRVEKTNHSWQIRAVDQDQQDLIFTGYDRIIIALPAPQAIALLGPYADLPSLSPVKSVKFMPVWAAMMAFSSPLPTPWHGCFTNHGGLTWIARNSSKNGRLEEQRHKSIDSWTAHASPAISQTMLEKSQTDMKQWFIEEMKAIFKPKPLPSILEMSVHRWLFAIPSSPLKESYLWDRDLKIGLCGDWCGGPKIEGAFLSGFQLAKKVTHSAAAASEPWS